MAEAASAGAEYRASVWGHDDHDGTFLHQQQNTHFYLGIREHTQRLEGSQPEREYEAFRIFVAKIFRINSEINRNPVMNLEYHHFHF